MKFDFGIGNPPYQAKSDKDDTKTQAIWGEFVTKYIKLIKPDGFLVAIHPSGWRGSGSAFSEAKAIKEKQIEHLEIHSEQDGLKTFGAMTRYDWYILKNNLASHPSVIVDQNGETSKVEISRMPFVPNYMIDKVVSLMAKNGEERVEILHSFSDYESRKPHISKDKTDIFCYPIIYSTAVDGPTIWYSSTNKNGHFGIPKVILNPSRPIGLLVDYTGEYGMSQFCVGIVGDKDYLDMVAEVIRNQKTNGFAEIMESCHFTDKVFNKEAIASFRKDFWKEFV